jgi:hypothetical protein
MVDAADRGDGVAMTTATCAAPPASRAGRFSLKAFALDNLYLATSLPLAIVAFTVVVLGVSLSLGLAVLSVGVVVALATFGAARLLGDVERRRAATVLGAPITPTRRPVGPGLLGPIKRDLIDPLAWREVAHALVSLPVATVAWSVWVTLWTGALAYTSAPLWTWALPDDGGADNSIWPLSPHTPVEALPAVPIGLGFLALALFATPRLARACARLSRAMLG